MVAPNPATPYFPGHEWRTDVVEGYVTFHDRANDEENTRIC